MKLLHVIEEKFDTSPPDLDKFVQIQQKPKYGFFTKTRFFSNMIPMKLVVNKTIFFTSDLSQVMVKFCGIQPKKIQQKVPSQHAITSH